jgi:hypothetical protein
MKKYFVKRENTEQFPLLIIGLLECKHLELQFSHKHNEGAIIVLSSQNFEIHENILFSSTFGVSSFSKLWHLKIK